MNANSRRYTPKELTERLEFIFGDIASEREFQNNKFRGHCLVAQRHPLPVWGLILGEEAGEVQKAVLESEFPPQGCDNRLLLAHLRHELVQTAAVCVAMIEQLDDHHYDPQQEAA